jgi:hypothetical protein
MDVGKRVLGLAACMHAVHGKGSNAHGCRQEGAWASCMQKGATHMAVGKRVLRLAACSGKESLITGYIGNMIQ